MMTFSASPISSRAPHSGPLRFGSGRGELNRRPMVSLDYEEPQAQEGAVEARREKMSRRTKFGLILLGGLAVIGGIVGGIGAACNIRPNGTVASLRMKNTIQIPDMCPKAYLKEGGDVVHPILGNKEGHIDESGKAFKKNGAQVKGFARGGRVYENYWSIDGAQFPTHKYQVDGDGEVRDGLTRFPEGNIKTHGKKGKDLPRNQRDALALWG